MHNEFLSLTKSLNVSLLGPDDIDTLNRLQKQWEQWAQRERKHAAARIADEQQAAFNAFLDNPSAEAEQRVALTADANLTGTRYAALRRAYTALRGRISAEASRLIRPAIDRALEALREEHARRREAAEPVMSSKNRNPAVIEAKRALTAEQRAAILKAQ